jgi:hypothetical protein
MRTLLLLPIYLLLLLVSCKKSTPPGPDNSISATVDGIPKTFNVYAQAFSQSNFQGHNLLIISGQETSEIGSININISVSSIPAIVKGSYSLDPGNSGTLPVGGATSITYVSRGEKFLPSQNATSKNLITITSLSSTKVEGTFYVVLSEGTPSTDKTITNGKFNVSIKPDN